MSIVPTVPFDLVWSVAWVVGPDTKPFWGTGTGLLKMPVTAVMTHNIVVNSIPEAQGRPLDCTRAMRTNIRGCSYAIGAKTPSNVRYLG